MKKFLSYICLVLAISCLWGCGPDGGPEIDSEPVAESHVPVKLQLGVVASKETTTRAGYSDSLNTSGELMKNWFVVIARNHQIDTIITNTPYHSGEQERALDDCWVRLQPGKYVFYSFANIQPSELGLEGKKKGDELPDDFEQYKYHVEIPKLAFADHWTDFGDDSQPFFKNGIPMSNRQEIAISKDTRAVDLEVIRMVAKVQLSITNTSNHPIAIKKVVLSDQTPNSIENLMLFPAADAVDEQGIAHVGKPNLCTQQKQVITYEGLNDKNGYVVSAHGGKQYIRFYVNESEATDDNKYFVLQLHTDDGNGGELTHRYAMLNWRQMCRNDFRMIPIQLDDYAIEWHVEAFSPIGVLPQVEEDNNNLTVTFGYYGEFHIIPKVRKISNQQLVDSWNISNQQVSEVVSTPAGDAGTCIFDTKPCWNSVSRRIEGEMGNRSGTSVYQLKMTLNVNGDRLTLARKVRFVMNPVNF